MEKKKKPYEKPELKGKITFEAAGAQACCKTSALGCGAGAKNLNPGKTASTKDTS